MILAAHTDASYFSEQAGKCRASGHFYLTNEGDKIFNNGTILTLLSIIKHVMSSASKAELAALYYGCKLTIPLCTTLKEMGHPQHKCTMGLTMGTMTPKHPNQWTNASTGLNVATLNNNYSTYGNTASTTEPTIPANIIWPNTTKQFGPSTSKTHYNLEYSFPCLCQFTFTFVDSMIQL
jgi:hypothetical protein